MIATFRKALDGGLSHQQDDTVRTTSRRSRSTGAATRARKWNEHDDTRLPLETLKTLGERITTVPENFKLHPRVQKIMEDRRLMAHGKLPLDWGMAEHLAYRDAAERRLFDPAFGAGQRARHVLSPPRRAARPEPRALGPGHLRAAAARQRQAGRFRRHRLAALGRGGGGLRVRLRDFEPERARDLGSAVRRLRQRRAGGDRPVHRLGRSEVGPHVRARHDAAARLRRAGAGALLGAHRALPAAVRRLQHAGLRAGDAGAALLPAAAADDAAVSASRSSSSRRRACCGTRNRCRRWKSSRTTSSVRSTRTGTRRTSIRPR